MNEISWIHRIFKFTSAAWHWGICPYSCAPVHVHVRDEGGLSTNSEDSFPYFEVQPDALCSWPPNSSSCPLPHPHRLFTALTSHHPHDHDLADSFPYFKRKLMCAHDPPIQVQPSLRKRCKPWWEQVKSSKYDRDMVNVEYGLDMADEKKHSQDMVNE